ncbi:MAG: hypothetical protein JW712_06975 [Dehalococcoidales bacterium]|nr:hypothetical protein [Dehalococcoidales bacterium]
MKIFSDCVSAPLEEDIKNFLASLFDMRWPGVTAELSPEDSTDFQRLCLPDSPDFILNHPDYCAFFTYTLFSGKK